MSPALWVLAGLLLGAVPPPQANLTVPFVRQERYNCAASCLAMIRLFWGDAVTQYEIARQAGWSRDRGLTVGGIKAYLDTLEAYRYRMGSGSVDLLKGWLEEGCPVMVALDGSEREIQHAVVMTGYDRAGFTYHDPARGEGRKLSFAKLAGRWRAGGFFYCLLVPASAPAPPLSPSPRKDPGR